MSWLINITSINWAAPPVSNQTVDVSYRHGGTSDAFTAAGSITFKPDGTINGTPNPFVISNIDDTWTSVEVDSVNTCNGTHVVTTFNKP